MTQVFTIDNGNSNPSVALFANGALKEVWDKPEFMALFSTLPNALAPNALAEDTAAIISDVGFTNELHAAFAEKLLFAGHYFCNGKFLDMPVNYSQTLGQDRLVLAYHAYKTMPAKLPVLIIDSGTFTTIDIVDNQGFKGGYIFPGLQRFLEIYGKSANLPDLSPAATMELTLGDLPHNTNDAILQAGVVYWRGIYREIMTSFGQNINTLVVTGGDMEYKAQLLAKLFTNLEIISDKNLIHYSLYTVYTNIFKEN